MPQHWGTVNNFLFFRKTYLTEIPFVVAKPNEACLYTMTIPMYLAWKGFPIYKLQGVIRKQIFLIHCAPTSPIPTASESQFSWWPFDLHIQKQ